MKKIALLLAVAALVVAGAVVLQAQEKAAPAEKPAMAETPWFDMENCGICKNLTTEKGLMEHMHWENYNIPTGMMSVTTVDEGWEEQYKRATHGMQETIEKLMAGEMVPLCGMCQAFGTMYMTGKVKEQTIDTRLGQVWVATSTDPEMIEQLHKYTDRTNEEMAKLEAAEKASE